MKTNSMPCQIRQAVSIKKDSALAVQEVMSQLLPESGDTVLCFSGQNYSPSLLEGAFQGLSKDIQFLACKTAGEITPLGYIDNSLTGLVLPAEDFTSEIMAFNNLDQLSLSRISELTNKTLSRLAKKVGHEYKSEHCFAMLLIDGLSQKEEILAAGINNGLDDIPLFGGSSADDPNYENAWIYCKGQMQNDVAALLIVHTKAPFKVFKTEHIQCKNDVYVTTKVNSSERKVLEVDGYPAAQWYAMEIGVDLSDLTTNVFAKNPVVVKSGGQVFIRSIQSADDDGGLSFYCAIEEGILLYLGQPNDLLGNLKKAIDNVTKEVGEIELLISCDCLLRNKEAKQDDLIKELSELFIKNKAIGFATFGEQFGGLHINQSFTGLAIGYRNQKHD